jgi:hypothetical protein
MKIDVEYAIHRLINQYGGRQGSNGQHPVWTLNHWQADVEAGRTGLGYWQYVVLQITIDDTDDGEHSLEAELKRCLMLPSLLPLQVSEDDDATLFNAGCVSTELGYLDAHEECRSEYWVDEVLCYSTRLGYWAWLAEQIREADSEDDQG